MKTKHSKQISTSILVASIFAAGFFSGWVAQPQLPSSPLLPVEKQIPLQVCFTPSMRCLPLIETAINMAQHSIYLQCYSFTSAPIAEALHKAHQRGVKVEIIADRSQKTAPYAKIQQLHQAGIPVYIDAVTGIAHNKIIICDEVKVISGSYNFSNAAENRNAENLIIIEDQKTAQQYLQNWYHRKALATPL